MKALREYKPNEIVMMYRNVFKGTNGNLVLEDILDTLGIFERDPNNRIINTMYYQTDTSCEAIALREHGMWILNRCGINNPDNQLDMVKALFTAVPVQSFEDKENEEDE